MSGLESLLLGILQGITEFLPISSSGHLVLAESWLGLEHKELTTYDIVVHLGTLCAILIYFRQEFLALLQVFHARSWSNPTLQLILKLAVATLPAVFVGLFFSEALNSARNPLIVGILMLAAALYFILAETTTNPSPTPENTDLPQVTWRQAILIGIAQSAAILPGVSRSGSTIATGLITGINRTQAARFSFLLGSIAITGAGVLLATDIGASSIIIPTYVLLIGFFSAALSGYLAVTILMKLLKNNSLNWFAGYLIVIGLIAIFLG